MGICERQQFIKAVCFISLTCAVLAQFHDPEVEKMLYSGRNDTLAGHLQKHGFGLPVVREAIAIFWHLVEVLGEDAAKSFGNGLSICKPNEMVASWYWRRLGDQGERLLPGDCDFRVSDNHMSRVLSGPENVFNAILSYLTVVEEVSSAAAQSYGLTWHSGFSSYLLPVPDTGKYFSCFLVQAEAYNVSDTWYIAADVTNRPPSQGTQNRSFLEQLVSIDPDSQRTGNDILAFESYTNESKTALLKKFNVGTPSLTLHAKNNTAVKKALELGRFEKESIEDTDTFSNYAILMLPAVLSLLPIALFQDASLLATLLYALVTDIISVFPLAIKGAELFIFGSREHYAVHATAEGWKQPIGFGHIKVDAAKCFLTPYVRQLGIGFLVAAIIIMVTGIILELVARRSISRRRKRLLWRGITEFEHTNLMELMEIRRRQAEPVRPSDALKILPDITKVEVKIYPVTSKDYKKPIWNLLN